jgi:hypothetical protein
VLRNEVIMIEGLLSGSLTIDRVKATPAELITVCLAVGRYESLPSDHQDRGRAWLSLESEQQTIIRHWAMGRCPFHAARRSRHISPKQRAKEVSTLIGLSQDVYPPEWLITEVGNITELDQSIVNDIADVITQRTTLVAIAHGERQETTGGFRSVFE